MPSTRHEGVLAHWFVATQVWSGFERCVFLFPYETTKRQGIPHDLDIMYELWRVERYQRRNRYLATSGVSQLVAALTRSPIPIKRARARTSRLPDNSSHPPGARPANSKEVLYIRPPQFTTKFTENIDIDSRYVSFV